MNDALCLHVALETEKCHSLLKVTPRVHDQVKALAVKLNWQPIDVASTLISYALDHVEISDKIVPTSSNDTCGHGIDSALIEAVADEVMARLSLDGGQDTIAPTD
jgi:hypothetical protein